MIFGDKQVRNELVACHRAVFVLAGLCVSNPCAVGALCLDTTSTYQCGHVPTSFSFASSADGTVTGSVIKPSNTGGGQLLTINLNTDATHAASLSAVLLVSAAKPSLPF